MNTSSSEQVGGQTPPPPPPPRPPKSLSKKPSSKKRAAPIKFDTYVKYLEKFEKKYHHINVKTGYVTNGVSLGRWLANCRQAYRQKRLNKKMNKQLSDKQIETLEGMGIVWNFQGTKVEKELDEDFMNQLASLTTYKRENGHYNIPAGDNLYEWIEHMRMLKKNSLLPAKHAVMLDAISFPWVPFQDGFELYTQYLMKNKSQDIPPEHPCYKWCEENREQYRNGALEKGLENILRACGFVFECANIRKTNGSMTRGTMSARSSGGNKENMPSNQSRGSCESKYGYNGSNHGREEGNKGLRKERNKSKHAAVKDSSSESDSFPRPKRGASRSFSQIKKGKMSKSYEESVESEDDSDSESESDNDTAGTSPPPRRTSFTRKALKKPPPSFSGTSSQHESSDSDTASSNQENANCNRGMDNQDGVELPNGNAHKHETEGGTAQDEAAPMSITANKRSTKDANEDCAVQVEGTSSQDCPPLTAAVNSVAACSNEYGDKNDSNNFSEDGLPQEGDAVNTSISMTKHATNRNRKGLPAPNQGEINKKTIMSLSKADLKEVCATRRLETSGLKPDLQKRLIAALK
jgi:hypothetical protein